MNAVKPILGEVKTSELLDDDDDDDVIVEEEDKQGLHFFISYDQDFSSVDYICVLSLPTMIDFCCHPSLDAILLWLQLPSEVEFKRQKFDSPWILL